MPMQYPEGSVVPISPPQAKAGDVDELTVLHQLSFPTA